MSSSDRTPQLRDHRVGIEGWDSLVRDLLPPQLDRPGARNEPPSYENMRALQEIARRTETGNRNYLVFQKRLGELPPAPSPSPEEKLPWMNQALHGSLAPFPSLQLYVSRLDVRPEDTTIRSSELISKLFEGTVLRPIKVAMHQEVREDKSIKESDDKSRVSRDRLTSFDKRWDDKIQPGLLALESNKPVPPVPEKLDLETIVQYRKSLTQYVDTMTEVGELCRAVSATTGAVHARRQFRGDRQLMFDSAGLALEQSKRVLVEQINLARQRLQALER